MADIIPVPADTVSAAAPVISVRAASKHYGAVHAVDGIDLDIDRGELFGLIGHNGAGKSTLFKLMLGLISPTTGDIRVDGAAVAGGGFRAVRRRIGYLPENLALYDNLSGLETLHFFAKLKGVPAGECPAALVRVGLADAAARPVREYSKGMRQRLGFAQAMLGRPRILFLDEPTSGLDPEAIRDFYAILRGLKEQGVTTILTSHILAEIQERVDRLAIMSAGRIQVAGTVQALREQIDLPLRFDIRFAQMDADRVRAALDNLPVATIETRSDRILVHCPREVKMRLLQTLAGLDGKVLDLNVREPSLEDVFFGLSDRN